VPLHDVSVLAFRDQASEILVHGPTDQKLK
jgi:hypothetical protein